MTPQVLRIGLVGCGRVAHERHLPAIAGTEGVKVTAVADTDRERAARTAARFGVPRHFGSHEELLRADDVDVVGVLTPTASHAAIACDALDRGHHVLVEKPVAIDRAQCAALIEAASRAAGRTTVAFNLRHHRLVRQARDVVRSGALGRVKAIRSAYTHDRTGADAPDWHRLASLGGGVTANEAVHHLDLWRFLLGVEVVEVSSVNRPSPAYEDETAVVMARLERDILATGVFTLGSSPTSEVDIYGDAGRLHLSCYRFDGLAFFSHATYPGDLGNRARKALASVRSLASTLPILRRGGDFQDSFRRLWQDFADRIRSGGAPDTSVEDGARAVLIAAACLESATSGQPVRLDVSR